MEMYTWFDPSFYKSGFFDADVTILGLTANTNFNIKLPSGASSNFRVQASGGGNLFQINQSSGNWIFSQVNQSIVADTSDGADNKTLYLCGGGGNSVGRGARCILSGNEVSGSQGIAYLWSGDASSAYVDLNAATAVSGNIRFRINSIDQARVTTSGLQLYTGTGMGIYRDVDTGYSFFAGGTSISSASGAYILAYGISNASVGLLQLTCGNSTSAYIEYRATHVNSTHRFLIGGTEQWRMSGNEFTGMNSASNQIARTNDTGFLILSGGSGAGAPANGAYVTLRGATASSPGIAIFSSASNSGAYCLYEAAHASGTHRFSIGGTERWRMFGDHLISYATTASNISRSIDTSSIRLVGGSVASAGNGAWIEAHGIGSGSGEGILRFYTGNHVNSHSIHIIGNASANHRFYIVGNERFTITDTGIVFPSLADGDAGNNRTYYSTTQSKLCYKDSGGAVNVLY